MFNDSICNSIERWNMDVWWFDLKWANLLKITSQSNKVVIKSIPSYFSTKFLFWVSFLSSFYPAKIAVKLLKRKRASPSPMASRLKYSEFSYQKPRHWKNSHNKRAVCNFFNKVLVSFYKINTHLSSNYELSVRNGSASPATFKSLRLLISTNYLGRGRQIQNSHVPWDLVHIPFSQSTEIELNSTRWRVVFIDRFDSNSNEMLIVEKKIKCVCIHGGCYPADIRDADASCLLSAGLNPPQFQMPMGFLCCWLGSFCSFCL